jgi:hypothetical protein
MVLDRFSHMRSHHGAVVIRRMSTLRGATRVAPSRTFKVLLSPQSNAKVQYIGPGRVKGATIDDVAEQVTTNQGMTPKGEKWICWLTSVHQISSLRVGSSIKCLLVTL